MTTEQLREAWANWNMDGTYIKKLSLADCRIIDERVIAFAESLRTQLAEKEREIATLREGLAFGGVTFCPDLVEDGTPWEVAAEPEPQYFETVKEAVAFLHELFDNERKAAEQRLQEAQADLKADDLDMSVIACEIGSCDATREDIVKRIRVLRQREAELEHAVMCMDRSCKRCNAIVSERSKGARANVTKDEVLKGLQAGRKLRCDRKDEPLLPWLLSHPDIDNKLVQADDQYSYIEFRWRKEHELA